MTICADLHTHSIASGHAFSTIEELFCEARKMGNKALAITDHAKEMPGSPAPWYFSNLVRQPDLLEDGFLFIKGVEANILDKNAALDVPDDLLLRFDWVIASLHTVLVPPMSYDEVTSVWLKVAENPYIDMAGHPEQRQYLFDYDRVTKAFTKNNTVVDLNAGSATTRPGNEENQRELALCCKRNGTKVAVNSDAHSIYQMHNLQPVLDMLAEIDFPEELVVNSSLQRIVEELRLHGRAIAERLVGKL